MTLAVVAAMEPELKELRSRLKQPVLHSRAGFEFHEGILAGQKTVLLLSGIGKVNAAVGTALLMERYKPDAVINTGVAGGFGKQLKVGDIVLSTEVRHHDVDVRPFGYEMGQVPQMPAGFAPDEKLLQLAKEQAAGSGDAAVHKGLIVSGDIFIHEPADASRILGNFPGALAGEMEAAAVAQTCHLFGVPWVIARSISDVIGRGGNAMEYSEFLPMAASRSADFVTRMAAAVKEEHERSL